VAITLQELATSAGGELIGDPTLLITGAASLPEATPGEISFFNNRRYMSLLRGTKASAVFVPLDFRDDIEPAQVRVAEPTRAFQQVVLRFAPQPVKFTDGVHPTAVIASDVKLGARVSIQPHAVIESGCTIGDDAVIGANCYIGHGTTIGAGTLLHPLVTVRERCQIGARVILHSGAVIGSDGFGFDTVDGKYRKVEQIGIVQIDDDVEVGANTCIDRARFGRTWIKEGVKLDNLVHIAHNVVVGRHSAMAAQAGIAGSGRIGNYVQIGGQAGINGHIEIGDRNIVAGQTAVVKTLPPGVGGWWGRPAKPIKEEKAQLALIHRLGKLFARVKEIEKKLGIE
jgi:UDP-3-O-[3-hydroxymyristoyl] glucosamine N-acyltransferase